MRPNKALAVRGREKKASSKWHLEEFQVNHFLFVFFSACWFHSVHSSPLSVCPSIIVRTRLKMGPNRQVLIYGSEETKTRGGSFLIRTTSIIAYNAQRNGELTIFHLFYWGDAWEKKTKNNIRLSFFWLRETISHEKPCDAMYCSYPLQVLFI